MTKPETREQKIAATRGACETLFEAGRLDDGGEVVIALPGEGNSRTGAVRYHPPESRDNQAASTPE